MEFLKVLSRILWVFCAIGVLLIMHIWNTREPTEVSVKGGMLITIIVIAGMVVCAVLAGTFQGIRSITHRRRENARFKSLGLAPPERWGTSIFLASGMILYGAVHIAGGISRYIDRANDAAGPRGLWDDIVKSAPGEMIGKGAIIAGFGLAYLLVQLRSRRRRPPDDATSGVAAGRTNL